MSAAALSFFGKKNPFSDPRLRFEAGKLGMWLFLASLAMLFGATVIGFIVIRLQTDDWPATLPPLPPILWLSTLLLLLSRVLLINNILLLFCLLLNNIWLLDKVLMLLHRFWSLLWQGLLVDWLLLYNILLLIHENLFLLNRLTSTLLLIEVCLIILLLLLL